MLNSIKFSVNNPLQKQLSFLLLGDMNYPLRNYAYSHRYYDSIQTSLLKDEDRIRVEERKPALKIISENQEIINLEDSLQKIALLSTEQREAYLKSLLKRLRKEKGLKDDEKNNISFGNSPVGSTSPAIDLFSSNPSDFYFLNTSLKARGSSDFKSRWGNRPNVDNWRRQSAVNSSLTVNPAPTDKTLGKGTIKKEQEPFLDIETLSKNIPLTTAQADSSNKSIIKAILENAFTFQNRLEDYPSAIEMYEELMRRYPENSEVEQALFHLAYCYKKIGNKLKADSLTADLTKGFAGGKYVSQLKASNTALDINKADPAQKQYENVYGLFLAGKFDEAKEAKLKADKQFGKNYWTPQLLYIESIYYIKQKEDSIAINRLNNIVSLFSKSPLAEKAVTMIDVLKRRDQIEYYLTNLHVEKTDETVSRRIDLNSTTTFLLNKDKKKDTLNDAPKEIKITQKELVDLSNTKTISTASVIVKDSIKLAMPKELKKLEVTNIAIAAPSNEKTYTFNPTDTQYVVVVLNNVDPIFITESRNAFNRYNQNNYNTQRIELSNRRINGQYNFLMFGPFQNAGEAIVYIDKIRPQAKIQIIPWLTIDKYSFSMISSANMDILLSKNDIEGYHTFIQKIFPDKF